DADVVMFIYRRDKGQEDSSSDTQNTTQILIAKHRNGPIGEVDLQFDAERVTFKNIDKRYQNLEVGT
ncbi:MAG: DnaB-like helicase C-terminal domain-containing protein, partial [Candidatus Liptonbacteria bacterium]|nr:DnaB-like helicase C-terminal domain-containing protein [Candidatus Liptonbacteria bacterium]